MRKLPVWRSISEVFSGVTRHYFDLIRVAPVEIAVIALGYFAGVAWQRTLPTADVFAAFGGMADAPWNLTAPRALCGLLQIGGLGAAAVKWHRFVLLGERRTEFNGAREFWDLNRRRYFVTILKMGILLAIVLLPVRFFVFFGGVAIATAMAGQEGVINHPILATMFALGAVYVAIAYLVARMFVAFPDAALGYSGSIAEAFTRTDDNMGSLLIYTVLIQIAALAISLFVGLGATIVVNALVQPASLKALTFAMVGASVIYFPVFLFNLMVGITMLSVAYREIVGLPAGDEAAFANEAAPA